MIVFFSFVINLLLLMAPLYMLQVFTSPALAQTLTLSFPLQCTLHETCFIQNYVDIDPSPEAQDYRCGEATYDGHKGTDFRVVSVSDAKKGVPVIAAAPGRVKAIRDGMEDRLVDKATDFLQGRECGNGVVIDHGQGWETQYCHMRRGSVQVRQGQQIKSGEPIGLVGYSGKAQLAHLHLSVRHRGRIVDPRGRIGYHVPPLRQVGNAGKKNLKRRGTHIVSGVEGDKKRTGDADGHR